MRYRVGFRTAKKSDVVKLKLEHWDDGKVALRANDHVIMMFHPDGTFERWHMADMVPGLATEGPFNGRIKERT